ncbi:MAG: AAA family ATPase [Planctomycetaceae bacterium]
MFSGKELATLAGQHKELLTDLVSIERELNQRFFESEKAVRAIILAIATGEPLLFLGPPGVAKSLLIRTFCRMTGLLPADATTDNTERNSEYFEYLLTPFSEPGELFGFWDLAKAQKGELKRANEGRMMQHARVVYLDEVFNGSSAILNSILSFLNERLFHDFNDVVKVKMECLFGATNQVPETDELQAVFDRFVLRCQMHNVKAEPQSVCGLLSVGWTTTFSPQVQPLRDSARFWKSLTAFRVALGTVKLNADSERVYRVVAALVKSVRRFELCEVSSRRLIKFARVMLAHRIYDGFLGNDQRRAYEEWPVRPQELDLFADYFLDVVDESEAEQQRHQLRSLTKAEAWAQG